MSKIHSLADVQSENIGKDTFVWQYTVILKEAIIGNNCNINCQVFIENDVIIGDNVTILKGVNIGKNAVIGAGSVVTSNIPENVMAAGNPCIVKRLLS